MKLDEAIQHALEVAEQQETLINVCEIGTENCKKCAEEHRQLANWLKELKGLREYIRVLTMCTPQPQFEDIVIKNIVGEDEEE